MLTFGPKSSEIRFLALLKRDSKRKLPTIKLSVDLQLQETLPHQCILMLLNFIPKILTMKMVKLILASTSSLSFVVSKRLNYIDWVLVWGSMA